jgi:8-oxo-dGTP pyrophosphatase MutT (NUDIX family)
LTKDLPERHVVTCFLRFGAKILLLRRSELVGSFRGRWAGVSGYMETTADEQALIEIEEETSLGREDLKLLKRGKLLEVSDEKVGVKWVVHPFLFQIKEPGKIKIDWEHTETRWIDPEDIDNYDTVPMLGEVLARVYETG